MCVQACMPTLRLPEPPCRGPVQPQGRQANLLVVLNIGAKAEAEAPKAKAEAVIVEVG